MTLRGTWISRRELHHAQVGDSGTMIVTWSDVIDKPLIFAPAPHTHPLTDLQTPVVTLADFQIHTLNGLIHVPAGGATGQVLTVQGDGSRAWQNPGAAIVPAATSTARGAVKTDIDQADPIVYTKTTSDTLLAGKLTQAAADLLYSALGHSHTFASLTSKPTTLSGYGITDAAPLVHVHSGADITTGTVAAGRLASHDIITAHSASGLTAGQVIRASGATTFAFAVLAFADLGSKPTTLAGYGITDAAALVHTHVAADITDFNSVGDARWAALVHAARHKSGGADSIKLDELAAPTDVATLNASAGAHGLLRKLSGTATEYLDGSGAWSTPAGGGGGAGGISLGLELALENGDGGHYT